VIPTGTANEAFWGAALDEGSYPQAVNARQPRRRHASLGTRVVLSGGGLHVTTLTGTWNFSAASDLLSYAQRDDRRESRAPGSIAFAAAAAGRASVWWEAERLARRRGFTV